MERSDRPPPAVPAVPAMAGAMDRAAPLPAAPAWVLQFSSAIEWLLPLPESREPCVAVQVDRSIRFIDVRSGQARLVLDVARGVQALRDSRPPPASTSAQHPGDGVSRAYFYDRTQLYAVGLSSPPHLLWRVRHGLHAADGYPDDPEYLDEILAAQVAAEGLLLVHRSGRLDYRQIANGRTAWRLPLGPVSRATLWSAGGKAACAWVTRGVWRLALLDLCAPDGAPRLLTLTLPPQHAEWLDEGLAVLDASGMRVHLCGGGVIELLHWPSPRHWPSQSALLTSMSNDAADPAARPRFEELRCAWLDPGDGLCFWSCGNAAQMCHPAAAPHTLESGRRVAASGPDLAILSWKDGARLYSAAGLEVSLTEAGSVLRAAWVGGEPADGFGGPGRRGSGALTWVMRSSNPADLTESWEILAATPPADDFPGAGPRRWTVHRRQVDTGILTAGLDRHTSTPHVTAVTALRAEWLSGGWLLAGADALAYYPYPLPAQNQATGASEPE